MTAAALNEAPTRSPIDQVLDLARAVFEAQMQGTLERAAKIKAAADAYVQAAEMTIAADIARRIGVEPPSPSAHDAAAQALRDIVLDLPELKATESNVPPLEQLTPTPVVVPMRSNLESYEASPEAKALWNELKSLEFETMSVPLFKATAAELAARAHILQDAGYLAEDIPGRVINTLNAIRNSRGIAGIYGLARDHKGDWPELARKAKADRERLRNGSGRLTYKLQIPKTTVQQVAEKLPSKPRHDHQVDDQEAVEVEDLPNLQVAARSNPVVLVGGLVVNEKLDWIKKRYGFVPEWIETEGTMKGVQSLEGRILDKRITAVVILEGLGGHKHFDPLVDAARQTGTPLVYGDTAGTGALRKAFAEIEERLT